MWTQRAQIENADFASITQHSMVFVNNSFLVVGMPTVNKVRCYTRSGVTWSLTQTVATPGGVNNFGKYIVKDAHSDYVAILCNNAGSQNNDVLVYKYQEGVGLVLDSELMLASSIKATDFTFCYPVLQVRNTTTNEILFYKKHITGYELWITLTKPPEVNTHGACTFKVAYTLIGDDFTIDSAWLFTVVYFNSSYAVKQYYYELVGGAWVKSSEILVVDRGGYLYNSSDIFYVSSLYGNPAGFSYILLEGFGLYLGYCHVFNEGAHEEFLWNSEQYTDLSCRPNYTGLSFEVICLCSINAQNCRTFEKNPNYANKYIPSGSVTPTGGRRYVNACAICDDRFVVVETGPFAGSPPHCLTFYSFDIVDKDEPSPPPSRPVQPVVLDTPHSTARFELAADSYIKGLFYDSRMLAVIGTPEAVTGIQRVYVFYNTPDGSWWKGQYTGFHQPTNVLPGGIGYAESELFVADMALDSGKGGYWVASDWEAKVITTPLVPDGQGASFAVSRLYEGAELCCYLLAAGSNRGNSFYIRDNQLYPASDYKITLSSGTVGTMIVIGWRFVATSVNLSHDNDAIVVYKCSPGSPRVWSFPILLSLNVTSLELYEDRFLIAGSALSGLSGTVTIYAFVESTSEWYVYQRINGTNGWHIGSQVACAAERLYITVVNDDDPTISKVLVYSLGYTQFEYSGEISKEGVANFGKFLSAEGSGLVIATTNALYVYDFSQWADIGRVLAGDDDYTTFGQGSTDGTCIAISSYYGNCFRTLKNSGGNWIGDAKVTIELLPGRESYLNKYFTCAAMGSDVLVTGAGGNRVFRRSGSSWLELQNNLGAAECTAAGADGRFFTVDSKATYEYAWINKEWLPVSYFSASGSYIPSPYIQPAACGNLLITAKDGKKVYVLHRASEGVWEHLYTLDASTFGHTVFDTSHDYGLCVAADKDNNNDIWLAVGCYSSRIFIYKFTNYVIEFKQLLYDASHYWGPVCGMTMDGPRLYVTTGSGEDWETDGHLSFWERNVHDRYVFRQQLEGRDFLTRWTNGAGFVAMGIGNDIFGTCPVQEFPDTGTDVGSVMQWSPSPISVRGQVRPTIPAVNDKFGKIVRLSYPWMLVGSEERVTIFKSEGGAWTQKLLEYGGVPGMEEIVGASASVPDDFVNSFTWQSNEQDIIYTDLVDGHAISSEWAVIGRKENLSLYKVVGSSFTLKSEKSLTAIDLAFTNSTADFLIILGSPRREILVYLNAMIAEVRTTSSSLNAYIAVTEELISSLNMFIALPRSVISTLCVMVAFNVVCTLNILIEQEQNEDTRFGSSQFGNTCFGDN